MKNCPKCNMPRAGEARVGMAGIEFGPKFGCGSIYHPSLKRFTVETTACREITELRSRSCPHVCTGSEGTSHCALAESTVKELEAKLAETNRQAEGFQKLYEDQLSQHQEWLGRIERAEEDRAVTARENNALFDTNRQVGSERDRLFVALVRAEEIAKKASLMIEDDHHELQYGCRFTGAVKVRCFACLVQDELAKIRVEALTEASREAEGGRD